MEYILRTPAVEGGSGSKRYGGGGPSSVAHHALLPFEKGAAIRWFAGIERFGGGVGESKRP